jgi:DNA-binding Lrp family transcriptional regulator
MNEIVEIDDMDVKILNMLIKDARSRLKDIAKECGTSSVSVLNRIKRLKNLKVITGSTIFPDVSRIGLPIVATIGINVDGNKEPEVLKALEEQAYLVEPAPSIGEYDLTALVFAKNISELDRIAYSIKEKYEARKVTINVWTGIPTQTYENVDLQPLGTHK